MCAIRRALPSGRGSGLTLSWPSGFGLAYRESPHYFLYPIRRAQRPVSSTRYERRRRALECPLPTLSDLGGKKPQAPPKLLNRQPQNTKSKNRRNLVGPRSRDGSQSSRPKGVSDRSSRFNHSWRTFSCRNASGFLMSECLPQMGLRMQHFGALGRLYGK